MDKRILAVGVVLIVIALIVGGLRFFGAYDYGGMRQLYIYGFAGVIGLIGIILAAWSYMMKPKPKKQVETQTQTQKQ